MMQLEKQIPMSELSVHQLTLVAISHVPKTYTQICKEVEQMKNGRVHGGSVSRSLKRAVEGGAAILIDDKYTEPVDSLSNTKGAR